MKQYVDYQRMDSVQRQDFNRNGTVPEGFELTESQFMAKVKDVKSIADQVAEMPDPYSAAIARFSNRDCPHNGELQTYCFADHSSIVFRVSHTVVSTD